MTRMNGISTHLALDTVHMQMSTIHRCSLCGLYCASEADILGVATKIGDVCCIIQ